MSIGPVFEHPVPSDIPPFTAGEKALSVTAAMVGTTGQQTFYVSRFMWFAGGNYVLKMYCDDAATFNIGRTLISSAQLVKQQSGHGAKETAIYIPAGLQRVDIRLSNISSYQSRCFFVLSLWKDGALVYASAADGWLMDTVPIPDSSLATVDDQLSVFSVLPTWQDGILERVGFLTDILKSETDREQRRAVRRYARRSIEATFLRQQHQRQRIENFLIGIRKRKFLVPLWFEQFRPFGGLSLADTTIQFPAGTLADRDFRVGDSVFVNNGSPEDYEILKVASRNDTTDVLTLVSGPVRNWLPGTRIIPLRRARILAATTVEAHTDFVGTTTIQFSIDEPENFFAPSWGHCSPLFRFRPNRAEPISVEYEDTSVSLDNETGAIYTFDAGDRARVAEQMALHLYGRKNVAKFRRFIAAARGRAVRFWCPTFTQDIRPAEDIEAGPSFDAFANGYSEYISNPQDARLMLAFTFKDGRPPVYRRVVGCTPVGTTVERFILEQNAPPMRADDIARIEFVMPSRFDQDVFELKHEVDDGIAVRTSLVIRSSDIDDMPPIDCWVTSKPYPIDAADGIGTTAALSGGNLIPMLYREAIDVAQAVLADGDLRTLLRTLPDRDPEAIEAAQAVFTGGDLRTLLRTLPDRDPEAIEAAQAVFTGGILKVGLVTYANWPAEAIECPQAIFIGGTLA